MPAASGRDDLREPDGRRRNAVTDWLGETIGPRLAHSTRWLDRTARTSRGFALAGPAVVGGRVWLVHAASRCADHADGHARRTPDRPFFSCLDGPE